MIDVITRLLMRIRHVYRYTLTDTEGVATPPSNTERCVRVADVIIKLGLYSKCRAPLE